MAAAEKIKTLNRYKGNIKGKLTKLQTFASEKAPAADIFLLKSKLDTVEEIFKKLNELKMDYFEIIEENKLSELESEFEELEESAEMVKVSLQSLIFRHNNNKTIEVDNNNSRNVTDKVNIKLPEIALPTFSGQVDQWNIFKIQFDSLITDNPSLNDTQRLFYLRSALKGNVKSIETPEDNFRSLMNALIERYENKRIVVNSYISNILNFEKITFESFKDLRNLIDTLNKNLRVLKLMELETNELSNQILINVVLQKLDKNTRKEYEMTLVSNDLPKWDGFVEFLQKRAQILENLQGNQLISQKSKGQVQIKSKSFVVKSNQLCVLCKKTHALHNCPSFLKMTPMQRFNEVKKFGLCINCLCNSHKLVNCQSKYMCQICNLKHNVLLHRETNKGQTDIKAPILEPVSQNETSPHSSHLTWDMEERGCNTKNKQNESDVVHNFSCHNNRNKKSVLLSTIVVNVWNPQRKCFIKGRCLLDIGSQSNFITSEFASALDLKHQKVNIAICSLSGKAITVKREIETVISNDDHSFSSPISLLIISKISEVLPAEKINISELKIPENLKLADPNFYKPAKIDLLIGAELFFNIVKDDKINITDSLILKDTVFGYIISGALEGNQRSNYCGFSSQLSELEENVKNFWKIEEITPVEPILSEEAKYCEEHYKRTHRREETGRYIVTMPMKEEVDFLGESKFIAESRLKRLNQKLLKNPEMHKLYREFMSEYETLGHMEEVKNKNLPDNYYYHPHHGVYRPEKTSTRLRVVFNSSSPVPSGQSLNDFLLKGHVVEDIFDILARFRTQKYAFTVDIKKMFRQILIEPSQRDFLRILWTPELNKEPLTYRLKTVTYGTACAPFLAIRTLKQLAMDEADLFPLASKIVLRDVYMDDVVSGGSDLETVQELQSQLESLFQKAGMQLHKWASNSPELLNSTSAQTNQQIFLIDRHSTVKTLGMNWHPQEDYFFFKVEIVVAPYYTKRHVLSVIARLYDPLGLLGPVIVKAKVFLQTLWLQKLNWEDSLPQPLNKEWSKFVTSLKYLENLKIPRYLLTESFEKSLLIGFADASESAYGAVVYMQCQTGNGATANKLIASKSRVSPLKSISIPRLELSACLLLSQLLEKIRISLHMNIDEVICYTDSTIALAWINTPPYKLKTFVSNRVSKIQTLTENCQWKHIPSHLNPADVISRGLSPQELLTNYLWFNGPEIIDDSSKNSSDKLDTSVVSELYLSELKKLNQINLSVTNVSYFIDDFLNLSNNYCKLIRIFSFICRFLFNLREDKSIRKSGSLSRAELDDAKLRLVKMTQVTYFPNELKAIKKGHDIKWSQVSTLNPFLDEKGIIRVGGRLRNSNLSYNQKFPILLPKNHRLTILIMKYYHLKHLHVGAQTLLYLVRQEFWPLGGRNTARKTVHDCVVCFKSNPKLMEQIMGNLPTERVTPSSPFVNAGIDFCGPFFIKCKNQRKGSPMKIYVALFVCLVTKAVHLEIVSDMTSGSLIAALKRFMGRRGRCSKIFSDNGSNLVRANKDLKEFFKLVTHQDEKLRSFFLNENIEWRFIPPRAPNFGGLWEAGIKSFKYYFKRIVGDTKVTYEEFLTVMIQIESMLNSRPLTPLSSDIEDLEILTPGHFLIGRPLTCLPEPSLIEIETNRLSLWQRTSKLVQTFWKFWSLNYLSNLQQRTKWYFEKKNAKVGDMVLIKEDNLPPSKWLLGRIVKIYAGNDKIIRVVDVRTKNGILKRPVTKLAILPIDR